MPRKKTIKLYSFAEIVEYITREGLSHQVFQAFDSTEIDDKDLRRIWTKAETTLEELQHLLQERGHEFIL